MAMDDDSFQQVLDTVSRFARERLIPAEREVEELDDIPEGIVQEMRDLGVFGLSIPEAYGGLELNVLQESQVVEALCYASMSFRSMIGTNVGIGAQGIVMEGTEAQKQQYLPGLATGELIASFALTEPDNGSDASHIRTSARKQFGVSICDQQLVQGLLADSQAELAAARALVRDAARKYDATGAAALEASCAKYFCSEVAGRVADRAVQVHGGAGYMAEYAVERLYRDARLLRIYEGTSQIQQIIIARNIIKAAKDGM
ncbi:acyl-CoA dehydrogenase family protein [Tropicibacter naphthalenivorans]|uniref:Acyl-CoA dehydrogenase n=1 Tax=Tropicibacter naphthalenivorans TaxID=441103 RepID=A0A0P1GHP8_9RHOB|nr:acyl-CoA dehydrogenase family protein [Tropicibacter naphthalenivorans]CUH81112.1 Acyl-CoA dehydrogenase [Tropicibacter naphthalenivorans]SMC97215.1 Acyl-CoA dehydrogenase, N-terminal domain [Tropicibacter naphthalenivorans]